jgi:microsomal dipeptidase-like Zn-dependent dipeptidase
MSHQLLVGQSWTDSPPSSMQRTEIVVRGQKCHRVRRSDCIDHIVKIAGVEHGIGSDLDGIPIVPRGLEDVSKMPEPTAALLKRDYAEQDIRKLMGENFVRVVRMVVGN